MTVDEPLVLTNEFVWTAPPDADGAIATHTLHAKVNNIYLPAVLLQIAPTASDSFCNATSGWPDNDRTGYALHYLAGPPCQYQIVIKTDNNMAAATPNWSATNYSLETLVQLDTNHTGGAGLLFGLNSDWSRFYVMGIGTQQKVWLQRYEGSAWSDVIPPTASTLINLTGENRVRLESQGCASPSTSTGRKRPRWTTARHIQGALASMPRVLQALTLASAAMRCGVASPPAPHRRQVKYSKSCRVLGIRLHSLIVVFFRNGALISKQ